MQLYNFSQKDKRIIVLCERVLKNKFIAYISLFILRCNPNWIEDNYSGMIPENLVLDLINRSCIQRCYTRLLVPIIDVLDSSSITDIVFQKLVRFPESNIKKELIVCLCHKELKEQQLLKLCEIGTEFECFFELAFIYYKSNTYSLDKLKSFLEGFYISEFGYLYKELLQELIDCHQDVEADKKKYVVDLLRSIR